MLLGHFFNRPGSLAGEFIQGFALFGVDVFRGAGLGFLGVAFAFAFAGSRRERRLRGVFHSSAG